MNKSTIIRQLRKWGRSKEQAMIEERKLIKFIDDMQGTKKQEKCQHNCYSNGYGGYRDVCSNCWKVLDDYDKQKACYY